MQDINTIALKKTFVLLAFGLLVIGCNENNGGDHSSHNAGDSKTTATSDTTKKSIPSETLKEIGDADVRINYHSPGVRGRAIWGGLVPYDEVWVTGAHKATSLEVSKDFKVGGKTIPAGKYALFTIPGKENWTVIINKKWDQHLADEYSETEDVVRVTVTPETTNQVTERLKYEIVEKGERLADIIISWEKIRVKLPLEVL